MATHGRALSLDTDRIAHSVQLAWLKTFLAVADTGGFSVATSVLHLSQPRVSAHVAALEHALDVALFDRTCRPTVLTPAGLALLPYARSVFECLRDGVEGVRLAAELPGGRLTVGSHSGVSAAFLPEVLATMRARYPDIKVELVEGTARELEKALASGRVQVALRPLKPHPVEAGLNYLPLWREAIVLLLRHDDELAMKPELTSADLVARQLVASQPSTERDAGGQQLRDALGDRADDAQVAYLTDHPATLVALVRSGLGIGVVNELATRGSDVGDLVCRQIDASTACHEVGVFWASKRQQPRVVDAFLAATTSTPLPSGTTPVPAPAAAVVDEPLPPVITPRPAGPTRHAYPDTVTRVAV